MSEKEALSLINLKENLEENENLADEFKSSMEKMGPLERKVEVEVNSHIVNMVFSEVHKKIQKQAEIKGFRKGKVPLEMVKTLYFSQILKEVINELVEKYYIKALHQHQLDPIEYPEFQIDLQPEEGKSFSFSMVIEIFPEVRLEKYEGLELVKEVYVPKEEKVEEVLNQIRNSNAEFVLASEDSVAELGDLVVIDFVGTMDGVPFDKGTANNTELKLGSQQMIPGFEEGIVGMKMGEERDLNLTFPSDYFSKEVAGKDVVFNVKLKKFDKIVLPEINDDFLKKMGLENDTVETFRNRIRQDIERTEKKRINSEFEKQILDQLSILNPVEVPKSLLKKQKASIAEDIIKRSKENGLSQQDIDEYLEKWDHEIEERASSMIKTQFVIFEIANKLQLGFTNEDYEKKMEEYSQQFGLSIDKVKSFYSQADRYSQLKHRITEKKVIDYIISKSNVVEKQ